MLAAVVEEAVVVITVLKRDNFVFNKFVEVFNVLL
jgi:hypothetical protein